MSNEQLWLVIGFLGQALFSARFLLQWWTSEKAGRSVVPTGFWYFSLLGSLTLLAYAVHKLDPVFILGQSMGFLIYIRNLHLIKRHENEAVNP
jgi:lipid-A-disaccharide synthase-like uncharacterized protein